MDKHRTDWNRQQQLLKTALSSPDKHPEWKKLFLSQHAQVHSSAMSPGEAWSFEDEVLSGLGDDDLRRIPHGVEHSIVWILFHLARIEDVTMHMLVAGTDQLVLKDRWLEKLRVPIMTTANALTAEQVQTLSQGIDLSALQAYRLAVGRNTQRLVGQLTSAELKRSVDPERIEKVRSCRVVVPAANEVLEYWSKRTIAGLLLMPPTRHCILHLNEALRIKRNLKIE